MSRREKFFMQTEPADAPDPPYCLIDKEPPVKVATMIAEKMRDLGEKFESEDELVKLKAGEQFVYVVIACSVIKLGGDWTKYASEWGEASPEWPRVLWTEEDYKARVRVVSQFSSKDASKLALKINAYLAPTENERENSERPPE